MNVYFTEYPGIFHLRLSHAKWLPIYMVTREEAEGAGLRLCPSCERRQIARKERRRVPRPLRSTAHNRRLRRRGFICCDRRMIWLGSWDCRASLVSVLECGICHATRLQVYPSDLKPMRSPEPVDTAFARVMGLWPDAEVITDRPSHGIECQRRFNGPCTCGLDPSDHREAA